MKKQYEEFNKELSLVLSLWVFFALGTVSYDFYILFQAGAFPILTSNDIKNVIYDNLCGISLPFSFLMLWICLKEKFKNKK